MKTVLIAGDTELTNFFVFILALLILTYSQDSIYAGTTVVCPEKIRPTAALETAPSGWTAMLAGSGDSYFEGVTIYDGHPKEMASLTPDNKNEKTNVNVWTIMPHATRRVWIGCRYRQTSLILGKEMPNGTSKCVVTYISDTKINDGSEIKSIECT